MISYFSKTGDNSKCLIEVTGKRCNLGVREGMQFLRLLNFEGRKAYRNYLNEHRGAHLIFYLSEGALI